MSVVEAEIEKSTVVALKLSKNIYYKTTIPLEIAEKLNIHPKTTLKWYVTEINGKTVAIVEPLD